MSLSTSRKLGAIAAAVLVVGGCTPSLPAEPQSKPSDAQHASPESQSAAADTQPTQALQEAFLAIPNPQGLIEINLDTGWAPLPETKDDGSLPVDVTITSDDVSVHTYGTIKVQGSSTAKYPKKNWSLKLYGDPDHETPLLLKIGDTVPSDQWVAKAEWVDPTQLRNHISYKLWGDMVESRNITPKNEVDNSDAILHEGAKGYPVTFLTEISVNDDFYGIETLTLSHDPRNYNIDPSNSDHYFYEFDARRGLYPEKHWDKFSSLGLEDHFENYLSEDGDFLQEKDRQRIAYLGGLLNGSQENFEEMFDVYLDKTNMIDMLLYIEVLNDWDGVAQDLQIVSYDGEKWYFLPWDKDTTFGMFWDGSGLVEGSETDLLINYVEEDPTQKPWFRTYRAFTPEVEARYAELREAGVFTPENISAHIDDAYAPISRELWKKEQIEWAPHERPSADETDEAQILQWFTARLAVLDDHFGYSGGAVAGARPAT